MGRGVAGGLGQLEIVAKDPVEAELELGQIAGFLFPGQQFLELLLAVFGQIEQFVQFGMVAGPEEPPLGDEHRRGIDQGPGQELEEVVEVVPARQQGTGGLGRGSAGQAFAQGRQGGQGLAQGGEIAGHGPAEENAGNKPLQVVDPGQVFPDQAAKAFVLDEKGHGFLGLVDGAKIEPRLAQHGFEQPPAHGRLGTVQHMPQRAPALAAVQAAENFQIALGDLVQEHVPAEVNRLKRPQVAEIAHVGGA